jgi:hypothetical protein
MLTICRCPQPTPSNLEKRPHRRICDKGHASSITPIAPIRATMRHKLLTAEANNTAPSRTTLNPYFDVIDHKVSLKRHYTLV